MHRRSILLFLSAVLAGSAASAVPTLDSGPPKGACEPFVDQVEFRYRAPTATVSGRVVPGSVREDRQEKPEFGQELVFGNAEIEEIGGAGRRFQVWYAYWMTTGGCSGWEPASGRSYTFDLFDEKSKDGTLRVMRYGAPPLPGR